MPMKTRFQGTKTPKMSKASPLNALVKTKKTRKPKALKPTAAMAKMIRSVVSKTEETKYSTEVILNAFPTSGAPTTPSVYVNFNSVVSAGTDWYRCAPLINPSGTAAYGRVGDQIEPTSLKTTWDFSFSPTSSDANSRDITIVMYILRPKQQKQYPVTAANGQLTANFNFLDAGNGTLVAYSGNQVQSYMPVDTRNYTLIKKKVMRLYKPFGTQNTNTPPLAAGSSTICATQVLRRQFSHTWRKLKPWKYDASGQVPTNFGDVWALGYYYNDGSPPDTSGGLLQVGCYSELRYKDA
nr:MAG: capsid protein [Cressdnaviricota sp.]